MGLIPDQPNRLYRTFFSWSVIGFLFLILHRFIFGFMYGFNAFQLESDLQTEAAKFQLIASFLIGLRFDLATLVVWVGPYFLFLSIFACFYQIGQLQSSHSWYRFKNLSTFLFVLEWLWLLWLNLVSMASTYNYSVNGKHLGWEFFAYFTDLPLLLAGSFLKDPIPTLLLALFIPVWLLAGFLLFRFNKAQSESQNKNHSSQNSNQFIIQKRNWWSVTLPVIILVLSLVLFRGGLQQNPLRPADAMASESPFLNNLKITGIYTIVHDLSDRGDFKAFYSDAENISYTQKLIDDGRPFINKEYPLLRFMEKRKTVSPQFKTAPLLENKAQANRPNFIVLLLESWSAKFLEAHGYDGAVAPNFNKLAKQGVFFKNFYSAGGRSANGLFSILTGIPDRAGRTVLRSSQIFNRFGALPLLLKQKGYSTLFVHGGDLHFDNLDTGLPHLGFDRLAGIKAMEESGRYKQKWTMGFHDEDTYDMLLEEIDQLTEESDQRPFFAMAFSSNNHHPFGLPNDSFKIFSEENDAEAAFKNSYHYADYSLAILIDQLKKKPYYENTIVVIVADHSHHANLDYLQDREIPMLVLAPHFFTPQVRDDVATQLDILPTILSLSGGDSYYASMGRDLSNSQIKNDHPPFAFFAGGSNTDIIGMIQGGFICYHYLRSNQSVLLKGTHPTEMKDIKNDQPLLFYELDQNTKHYYQFARTLEQENRIWPDKLATMD